MRKIKKAVSTFVVLVMLIVSIPIQALASEVAMFEFNISR